MEYTKKLHFLFFSLTIIYSSTLISQDTWVRNYRPFQQPYLTDRYSVEDVLVTQDGGYVVSGSFELFDEFYNEHWGFLMKTDSDGNMLWAVKDSVDFMSENGYNVDFTELEDGSFISIGYQGFGGGRYMIKRVANGDRLWATPFDPDFGVFSIQSTNDGNVILAGRADYNAALRKITPDGNTIWTNIVDLESSIAYSVTQSNDGGYLLTGINYGENDILTIKTDANGDSLWTKTFQGLGGNDKGYCVIEAANDDIFVCGRLHDNANNNYQGIIIKYNSNGNTYWNQIEPSSINFRFVSAVTDNNDIIAYGTGNSILTNLYKYDSVGDNVWIREVTNFIGEGDRCLRKITNENFIIGGDSAEYIHLTKTDSNGQFSAINHDEVPHIDEITLSNYPNPFNPETNINFNLPNNVSNPVIEIFNIKGEKIRAINSQNHMSILWDGTDNDRSQVASGIYLYRLKTNNFVSQTKKMTLLK